MGIKRKYYLNRLSMRSTQMPLLGADPEKKTLAESLRGRKLSIGSLEHRNCQIQMVSMERRKKLLFARSKSDS